jgi:hypothetical protein
MVVDLIDLMGDTSSTAMRFRSLVASGQSHSVSTSTASSADEQARLPPLLHSLARGWPISTGVIEGACRHLAKDPMDITGPAGDSRVARLS